MADYRTVMTWPSIASHSLQIVGTLDPDTHAEQWLPECTTCGWMGDVCDASVVAQQEIWQHLGVEP